jgi:hypothetical protein
LSTIKANAVTGATTNSDLTLSGNGTGGVKVNDYFVQTKGSDIASATSLTLGKDGNQFDVTGTTTITSIATQGIGSYVTLHFDGALTFTHHSTDLVLPGAANITTAAGDIAVMYEYASGDWRCVSYTKASGAAVVAGGGFEFIELVTASTDEKLTFTHTVVAGYDYMVTLDNIKMTADPSNIGVQCGTGGTPTFETSGYLTQGNYSSGTATAANSGGATAFLGFSTDATAPGGTGAGETISGYMLIINPAGAAITEAYSHLWGPQSNGSFTQWWNSTRNTSTTAVTAFRVEISAATTFATGTAKLSRRKNA